MKKSLDIPPGMGEYRRVKDKIINQTNGSPESNITYKGLNSELGTPQANGEIQPPRVKIEAWYQPNFAFHSITVWVYPASGGCSLLRPECGPSFGLADCVEHYRLLGVRFWVEHSVFRAAVNETRPLCGEFCPVECPLPLFNPLAIAPLAPVAPAACPIPQLPGFSGAIQACNRRLVEFVYNAGGRKGGAL